MSPEPIRPSRAGICPYCGNDDLDFVKAPRMGRRVMRCDVSVCARHSVEINGKQFPMTDPSDPDSAPALVGRG